MRNRLAIVTQDPANYGGVLRLAEYIYRRAEATGLDPGLLHYGRFENHPEVHASLANLLNGELNLSPISKKYTFNGMRARAIGATFPEWEPNRLHANRQWRNALSKFDRYILVTGSAQTGLPIVEVQKPFSAWASSTVETDRSERLGRIGGFSNWVEKAGLKSVLMAENKVLQSALSVMAVSEDTQKHLAPLAKKEVSIWPYPVDTLKFLPGNFSNANSPKRFIFVGRANDPRKRIELFFRSCSALMQNFPNLDFVATVVSSELPVTENLNFKIENSSNVSDRELIELYRNSTAFVLTSQQEGLGIAAMEAMACGLPVISTRCGGPETFIQDSVTGFFVDDQPEAIAERMLQLATDETLRKRFGESSRHRIDEFFSERVWNEKFENMLLSS